MVLWILSTNRVNSSRLRKERLFDRCILIDDLSRLYVVLGIVWRFRLRTRGRVGVCPHLYVDVRQTQLRFLWANDLYCSKCFYFFICNFYKLYTNVERKRMVGWWLPEGRSRNNITAERGMLDWSKICRSHFESAIIRRTEMSNDPLQLESVQQEV